MIGSLIKETPQLIFLVNVSSSFSKKKSDFLSMEMLNFAIIFHILLTFLIHANSQTLHRCIPNNNFTANSSYESSLSLLFSTLSTNAPGTNGFFNSSVIRTPNDTVYGIFQCRGDTTDGSCRDCVMEATRNIAHQFCPFKKSAVVWYDDCLLRYSDQNFFSVCPLSHLTR